jgi:SAM-dependent methyltransferase
MTRISYGPADGAWKQFDRRVEELTTRPGTRVCDLGGGATPVLPPSIVESRQLDYTLVDISSDELAKAPDGYRKVLADLTDSSPPVEGHHDVIVSRFLAEHLPNPRAFHENVLRMLAPGGRALHFFSTLYSLPFLVNRVLPENVSHWLVKQAQPDREVHPQAGKWPAYYRWCRGPTPAQIERFERVGFEVEWYAGFFGTRRYYTRWRPLERFDMWLTDRLVEHPIPLYTSFAQLLLRRPE